MTGALRSGDGSNTGAFGVVEWGLLITVSLIWGSSFLWISIGLDSLHPGVIAFVRVVLGAAVLGFVPAARAPVARSAWPAIALIACAGNIAPALLFAFAEQRIESSVAGMINAASPLMVLALSIGLLRKSPGPKQVFGLALGFVGGVLLALPNVIGADAEPLGVLMVLIAIAGYSISSNVTPPVVQEFGAAAVILRSLIFSSVVLAPYGIYTLKDSSFAWGPVIAIAILGIVGTGIARSLFGTLLGRAGAPRSSMVAYFVPVVAVVLGVTFRSESVSPIEVLGLAIILLSAWLISRAQQQSAEPAIE